MPPHPAFVILRALRGGWRRMGVDRLRERVVIPVRSNSLTFLPICYLCAGRAKLQKKQNVTTTLTPHRSAATITRHIWRQNGRRIDHFTFENGDLTSTWTPNALLQFRVGGLCVWKTFFVLRQGTEIWIEDHSSLVRFFTSTRNLKGAISFESSRYGHTCVIPLTSTTMANQWLLPHSTLLQLQWLPYQFLRKCSLISFKKRIP